MDTPAAIGLTVIGAAVVAWLLFPFARRLWATELVQEQVLRWTGESSYLPTSWMHKAPTACHCRRNRPTVRDASLATGGATVGGSLVGGYSPGSCRMPSARAQAPAAESRLAAGAQPVSVPEARGVQGACRPDAALPGADTGTSLAPDAAVCGVPEAGVTVTVPTARSGDATATPPRTPPQSGGGVAPQLTAEAQCQRRRASAVHHASTP